MIDKKNKELECLEKLATEFKIALLECVRNSLILSLHDFPRDSCGEASQLLATYLRDKGQGIFEYTLGEIRNNNNYQSHAWLTKENIIVDITANQFPDVELPVIVTTNNSWHKKFNILENSKKDIDNFNYKPGKKILLSNYRIIIDHIK